MTNNLPNYLDSSNPSPGDDQSVSEILEELSEQEEQEVQRLEEKLSDVRQQLEEERKVLEENLDVIYRQIGDVQDELRELDVSGHKSDSAIRKERELRKRLEELYGDVRRERREWRRDRQKPLREKRELEQLIEEHQESTDLEDLF